MKDDTIERVLETVIGYKNGYMIGCEGGIYKNGPWEYCANCVIINHCWFRTFHIFVGGEVWPSVSTRAKSVKRAR